MRATFVRIESFGRFNLECSVCFRWCMLCSIYILFLFEAGRTGVVTNCVVSRFLLAEHLGRFFPVVARVCRVVPCVVVCFVDVA